MKNSDEANETHEAMVSERDERLLKYLVVLIAYANQQQAKPPEKGFWSGLKETFRTPSVVATIITVLIGGVAATWISGRIQSGLKERESEQGLMKSQNDQELVQYTKYLDQEQALISRVYKLIGACTSAGDNVIGLTRERWQKLPPGDSQVKGLIHEYNMTKVKWDSEALELEQLMGYYHPKREGAPEQSEVVTAWREIPDAVRAYLKCADDWYEVNKPNQKLLKPAPDEGKVANACKKEYGELVTHLSKVTSALALSQPHPVNGLKGIQKP
jgi:hypothetical protein